MKKYNIFDEEGLVWSQSFDIINKTWVYYWSYYSLNPINYIWIIAKIMQWQMKRVGIKTQLKEKGE